MHGRLVLLDVGAGAHGLTCEIVEASVAHTLGDAVELAYRRTDFLDKRRALMEKWAQF